MKTIQKLEIFTGVATLITALLYFYFGYFRLVKDITVSDEIIRFVASVVSLTIPSAMVAAGAYYNVIKQSKSAVISLCIGGVIVIIIFALNSLAYYVYGGIFYSLLVITPSAFAFITIILALYSRTKSSILS